jgi:hypothetical protein
MYDGCLERSDTVRCTDDDREGIVIGTAVLDSQHCEINTLHIPSYFIHTKALTATLKNLQHNADMK